MRISKSAKLTNRFDLKKPAEIQIDAHSGVLRSKTRKSAKLMNQFDLKKPADLLDFDFDHDALCVGVCRDDVLRNDDLIAVFVLFEGAVRVLGIDFGVNMVVVMAAENGFDDVGILHDQAVNPFRVLGAGVTSREFIRPVMRRFGVVALLIEPSHHGVVRVPGADRVMLENENRDVFRAGGFDIRLKGFILLRPILITLVVEDDDHHHFFAVAVFENP